MKDVKSQKMYYFFIGTNAELIKLIVVLKYFRDHHVPFKIISSGQNNINSNKSILNLAGIDAVDIVLYSKPIRQTFFGLLIWFFKTLFIGFFKLKKEFENIDASTAYMIVHGDALSTLMGAYLGFLHAIKVAHVEAGYRSFNFLQPFPEEIDRFLVSFVASVHFCAYEDLIKNIEKRRGVKINTYYNTLIDSLYIAKNIDIRSKLIDTLALENFFIFIMHRQENLFNEAFVRKIISKITTYNNMKCLFIVHESTRGALEHYGLLNLVEQNKNILLSAKLNYMEFIKILTMSEFIMTDGGGNQQESYYLGKPCLLLRKVCEGKEGIDRNVVLLKDDATMDYFLENYKKYASDPIVPKTNPSEMIAKYLIEN